MSKASFPTAPHPFLFLPDGWDTGWKAAKAASGTTPAWINVFGDSISTGNNSTDPMTKSFLAQLRTSLKATYGLYADLWTWSHTSNNTGVNAPPTAYPFVLAGGATSFNSTPFTSSIRSDSNTQTITFTSPYACTAMDILYYGNHAGSWVYSLDGAANVTVTNNGQNIVNRIALTSLSNTTHTLLISGNAAAAVALICGIVTYNATTGLGFNNMAVGGITTTNVNADAVLTAILGSSTGTYTNPNTLGYPSSGSLHILGMGINDCSVQNTLPNQYEYVWDRVINLIRWSNPNASIMHFIPCNPRTYSDAGSLFGSSDLWPYYKDKNYKLAARYNNAVIDIDSKWGNKPVAKGFLTGGNGHPNDAGYTDIAATMLGVL